MSNSNYNTQLQSNNADLQTVLQTLQTKVTGSGGDIETCTVMATTSSGYVYYVTNVFNNGKLESFCSEIMPSGEGTITIENVVIGTTFKINNRNSIDAMFANPVGLEHIGKAVADLEFKVTAAAGGTASVMTHPVG